MMYVNSLTIERTLKFTSTHQLLSFSLSTNVPGCESDFFACRQGDTETDINDLVEKFVAQLSISEKSFNEMQYEYRDVVFSLDQAIAAENVNNASTGLKDSPISDIKF